MENTSTSDAQVEAVAKHEATMQVKAQAVVEAPRKSTLDLVREKMQAHGKAVEPVKAPEVARGADGKFAPKVAATPDTKEQPALDDKARVAREERALQGLRRAKVSQSILEKLSDDDRIQMGLDFADQQSVLDRKFSEKGTKESRQAEPAKDAGQPQTKADDLPKFDTKAIAEDLALDEGGVERLNGFARSIAEPLLSRLTTAEQTASNMAQQFGEFALESHLSRLVGDFPELSDAKTLGEVRETVHRLAESDAYEDLPFTEAVSRITEDAIWRVCRTSIQARRAGTEAATNAVKRAGQPSVGSRHGDGSLTAQHPVYVAKALMDAGYTPEQARAEVNRRFSK